MLKTLILSVLLVALGAAPAPAQNPDPPAALAQAEKAYSAGDFLGALDALWDAQVAIWNQAPLGVRNVALAAETPVKFGDYRPKTGEDYHNGEQIILYCEPIGFTQEHQDDGWRYSLTAAFEILDFQGQPLGGYDHLGPFGQNGYKTFTTETMLVMTIAVNELSTGAYTLRLTLTDDLAPSKSVQIDKPFNIVP